MTLKTIVYVDIAAQVQKTIGLGMNMRQADYDITEMVATALMDVATYKDVDQCPINVPSLIMPNAEDDQDHNIQAEMQWMFSQCMWDNLVSYFRQGHVYLGFTFKEYKNIPIGVQVEFSSSKATLPYEEPPQN